MSNLTRFLGPEPSLPAQAQRSALSVGTTARRTEVPTRPPLTLVEPEATKNRLIAALPLPVRERWMLLLEVVELPLGLVLYELLDYLSKRYIKSKKGLCFCIE